MSAMSAAPVYSTLFHCLYDQAAPAGQLGRGAHYSVFRSVEHLDVEMKSSAFPLVHDFAVVWDEDHDTRVIEAIELIYMANLLAPVQFIGERKGVLTLILAARAVSYMSMKVVDYMAKVKLALGRLSHGDSWAVETGMFDRRPGNPHQNDPCGIIADEPHKVEAYLLTIDALWGLGTRAWNGGQKLSRRPKHMASSYMIDLNDPANLSRATVARLLASTDDSRSLQLRITEEGVAFLSTAVGSQDLDGIAVRFETLDEGNGYVGSEASQDENWVKQVYDWLHDNWPNPVSSYVDY